MPLAFRGEVHPMEYIMKKTCKLIVNKEDFDNDDSLGDILDEGSWVDTGTIQILIPEEMVEYLDRSGILGLA